MGQKSELNKKLDEKVNILKSKTEQMAELIEKAKKYSDPNTQELLTKWEASNKKMKDLYEQELVKREENTNNNEPDPKDIDRLINKLQQSKPEPKKDLPVVKSNKKVIQNEDSDEDVKTVKSSVSNKKSVTERQSVVSTSSKPPLNTQVKQK